MKDGSLRRLREIMAVLADTEIEIIAGDAQPHAYIEYAPNGKTRGPIYAVGIKWLEQYHPDAFAEVLKARLLPTA